MEQRFRAELFSDLDCVNQLVEHIERYRGKMLRPTLVLVAAAACEPDEPRGSERHRILATVVEMVHMATLVHDDILDDADVRRRGSTINHLSGNEAAVMLGDYLISHAYHLCSALDDQSVSRAIARTTNTVCEGELLQLANRNNWRLDERTYFEIIRRKTASLVGSCCALGASLSGAAAETVETLRTYGEKVGIAFQIVDDVLDVCGEPEVVGKTLGRDLEKGKLTLPVIRRLQTAGAADRRRMLDALEAQADESLPVSVRLDRRAWLHQQVLAGDGVEHAKAVATALVEEAKLLVEQGLESSEGSALLRTMADEVVRRRF